jgi:tetratricopeptide (TPR) repeat protein
MFGIRPAGRLVAAVSLLLMFPGADFTQSSPGAPPTSPPAPASAPENKAQENKAQENNAGISVMVRTSNGASVDTLALVTLYDGSGQSITSKATTDSLASFVPLSAGSYIIDIDAPGFAKARREAKITEGEGEQLLIVTLKPDTGSGITYSVTSTVTLPPKPQKEVSKGLEALRAGKFDEAVKHLQSAQHMDPKEAEIASLLGSVYEKKSDLATARKYWDQAIQLDPKHLASLLACGDLLLRQKDLPGARKYLEQAVQAGPNSWRAHALLAAALLQQNSYVDTVSHAQRAIELGKSEANSARLTLGQALAFQHKNEEAIAALQAYISGTPSKTMAEAAQNMIERLRDASSTAAAAAPLVDLSGGANKAGEGDDADAPLSAAAASWLPPDVDAAVPSVEPGVACDLDNVLKKASAVVQELPKVVDRYTATEVFHQENINTAGYAESVADMSFNYLASVRDIKSEKYGEALDVQEYRNGSTGTEMFPNHEGSVGLPSIVLIFHPLLISDFEMKCEGLSRAHGNFAWQINFRQRSDRQSRIRRYLVSGHVYPIALKGRAWIDANTFQIVRLETDLREPHPEIHLNAEHLIMEYGPVKFQKRKEELWLPVSADYYAVRRSKRFHRRHAFTNYILFSIDMDQKIGTSPKEKTSTSPPQENKSSKE